MRGSGWAFKGGEEGRGLFCGARGCYKEYRKKSFKMS